MGRELQLSRLATRRPWEAIGLGGRAGLALVLAWWAATAVLVSCRGATTWVMVVLFELSSTHTAPRADQSQVVGSRQLGVHHVMSTGMSRIPCLPSCRQGK